MSLLPGTIIPQTVPFGRVSGNGAVIIEKNWWLLLYNLVQSSIGDALTGQIAFEYDQTDIDVIDADAAALRGPLANLQVQQLPDYVPSSSELPDISRALLLAQEHLLPDPVAAAQPFAPVSPTGSPFAYTAPFAGHLLVTGGGVSGITLTRQGTNVATGMTSGFVPVSRGDVVTVTYGSTPTLDFIPT